MSTASQETIERLKQQVAAEQEEEEVTPAGDSPDPEKKPKPVKPSTREYIVFMKDSNQNLIEITRVEAGSAESAILSLGDNLKDGTPYAATPSRNWHEVTPTIETTTSIKLK